MKQIDNVNLTELVTESSKELISEKRSEAANIIKNHLQRIEQLSLDVRKAEKELNKKTEALKKAQEKMDKIKAGDWSQLAEKKDGPKGHNQGSNSND